MTTSTNRSWTIGLALAVVGLAGWILLGWIGSRDRAEIMDVVFDPPRTLHLMIASCNGAPVAEVFESEDGGLIEIEVRTTQDWDRGTECADSATIQLGEELDDYEIVDRTSGRRFTVSDGRVSPK